MKLNPEDQGFNPSRSIGDFGVSLGGQPTGIPPFGKIVFSQDDVNQGYIDYVNNGAPLAMLGGGGLLAPTAIVSPALLFEEIEFELPQEQLPKLPVVPAPTSSPSN